jgi:hypothetical protein
MTSSSLTILAVVLSGMRLGAGVRGYRSAGALRWVVVGFAVRGCPKFCKCSSSSLDGPGFYRCGHRLWWAGVSVNHNTILDLSSILMIACGISVLTCFFWEILMDICARSMQPCNRTATLIRHRRHGPCSIVVHALRSISLD